MRRHSAPTTPAERYREKPRCRTCRHRPHEGRKCNGVYCACGDVATVPDAYPFEIPVAGGPSPSVLLRRQENDALVYAAPCHRGGDPGKDVVLLLRVRQEKNADWVAAARGPGFDIASRGPSPDRALSVLHRCLRGLEMPAAMLCATERATRDPG